MNTKLTIQSIAGTINLESDDSAWNFECSGVETKGELEHIHFRLSAPSACPPPVFLLKWMTPQHDMQFFWEPSVGYARNLRPDWWNPVGSNLASNAPFMQLGSQTGFNRLSFAVSEAMRQTKLKAYVVEESNQILCQIQFFTVPEAPMESYEFTLRLDLRNIPFADAIRDAFAWFETFPEYKPVEPPPAAFEPLYSAWYSYHQDVHDFEMEKECRAAAQMGMGTIIVDDGWQTDDTNRGYAFCGDWEISPRRFPDMRAHVDRVHKLGMKYMIWYSVPFLGFKSRNYEQLKAKTLYTIDNLKTAVLDPRFPEIREFLITTWETAVKNWNLDGLKLDFIDSFCFPAEGDPAVKENYAGRDIKSLPLAVDALLSEAMKRLNEVRPGILIEFRQSYMGPAIRKYGNMLRAGDCPGDLLSNRTRTIDLRLTSGRTAVHSDMLEWNFAEKTETAALQLLNVLFSVPQISVKLEEMPAAHRRMLIFWLTFWRKHRDLLMNGKLMPFHPELNYPVVTTENEQEFLAAVYNADEVVVIPEKTTVYVVNASGKDSLILDLPDTPSAAQSFDVCGNPLEPMLPDAGLTRVTIPESGILILKY